MSEYIEQLEREQKARVAKKRAMWEKIMQEEHKWEDAYLAAGLGCLIPTYHLGFRPSCVINKGGAVAVYQECIKRGISWEEYCHYDPNEHDPAGCNM